MNRVYKVSELVEEIKWFLEDTYGAVSVEGEASEVRYSQKGHLYFYLKDEKAILKVVMWAGMVVKLPFKVEEGRVFVVTGNLTIYPVSGSFQLEARKIEPAGIGALKLALEQRKKKLQEEGLFDEEKKKPLPLVPQRIGVITSLEGAAIKDFLKILKECKVNTHIKIFPSLMQGKGALNELIEGLDYFEKEEVDLVVITRGGGSFEDLMVFNEELLVRKIFGYPKPVLSAVGHEIDVTLCDLVADIRAATPTDAARIIKNRLEEVLEKILEFKDELEDFILQKLEREVLKIEKFAAILSLKNLKRRVGEYFERIKYYNLKLKESQSKFIFKKGENLKYLNYNLSRKFYNFSFYHRERISNIKIKLKNIKFYIMQKKEKIEEFKSGLNHLNVKRTLKRGFSILRKDGEILRDSEQTKIGDNIEGELYKGRIRCQITKKEG
ncbi:MAG: exodeoxyribonuclease VII large subunit [Thermoanaerobaculia bacterium]